MAVTLLRIRKVINNIHIINGVKKDDEPKNTQQEINAKIRGKMYARRTVNRQD